MKNKRIVSIFLIVFLIASFFVLPASALDYAENEFTTAWESGYYDAATGAKVTIDNNFKYIRLSTLLDVSSYDKIRIHTTYNVAWNVHFFDANGNFISSVYAQNSYSNSENIFNVAGPHMAVSVKASSYILPQYGSGIKIAGLRYPTIDTAKTGSLTINKYEMQTALNNLSKGTGKKSDSSNVPSGATPLGNVTFKITKVKNISPDYYTSAGTSLPTVAQAQSLAQSSPIATYTQTTNSNGLATFSSLPLGIYLVQETSSPNQVMTPMDDQVISIPSMDPDGYRWNYDVVLYPKNLTKYTNIDVQKTDDGAYLLAGAEFTLERKVNGSWKSFGESKYTSSSPDNSGGKFTMNNLPVNYDYRLTETKTPTSGYYIADNALSKTEFHIDTNGYISSVTGYAVKVNNTTLRIKNTRPTIEKFIDRSRGASTNLVKTDTTLLRYNDNNDFQYYTVKIRTPHISDMSTLNVFKVTDSIGQTVIEPIVTKIVKGSSAIGSTLLDSSAYTYTATTTSTSWNKTYNTTIDFDTSKLEPDTYYWITYKVYIVSPVSNAAKVVYSKSTSSSETGTITIGSNTVRYIRYGYKITKKNENNGTLAGASFRVYATKEDAVAKKNSLKMIYWNNINGIFYKTSNGSDGTVTFADCFDMDDAVNGQKDFWIAETEAPTGYNLLAEPIKITVTADTYNSSQFNVVNTKKFVFPLTGGMGIWLFVVIGILFISVSIVIIKKRYEKHQGGNSI